LTTNDLVTLRAGKNFLLTDAGVGADLTKYLFKGEFGEFTLDQATFADLPQGVSVAGGFLVAAAKGIFFVTGSYSGNPFEVTLIAKEPAETEYVIFEASYSQLPDGPIPDDYTINSGAASIKDGRIQLEGRTNSPTRVLLPGYLQGFKNYIIESDFTILSANEPTRWASFMYRFGGSGYFQMAIRQNATATNGVEFAKWINNGWNVPKTTSHTEAINPEKMYRIKIDLFGETVREYIDGTLMITYENASDFTNGYLGMQASGAVAVYNNIKVTLPVDYVDTSSIELTMLPELYTPETGAVQPPSVMKWAESAADLTAMTEEVRPQVLILQVDHTMEVVNSSGLRIMPVLQALQLIDGRVIPAFYVRNRDVAVNLAGMLKEYGVRDVFLISRNPLAITDARTQYNMLRGILEIDYVSTKPNLGSADLLDIRNRVNMAGALGALLPYQYVTKENVEYLQWRLVSVFANATNQTDAQIHQGILSGANGVLTNDIESAYALMSMLPANSILRTPMIIGHRGMPSKAPENSLEGSILAYQEGANVIELDIYLSSDNRLIVMHDATTGRTASSNLTVESSTLEQLKELTLQDTTGNFPGLRIPTLDEYFAEFKGKDVQIFIEIKSTKPEIVPVLRALIEEYEFFDQVVVITFHTSQADNMRLVLPEISVGYLNTSLASASNLNGSILSILNNVVPIKTTYNPEVSPLTPDLLRELNYRGITTWPWTINTANQLYQNFVNNVGGLTTNFTYLMKNDWVALKMNQTRYSFQLSEAPASVQLRAVIETLGGQTYEFPPEYILLTDGGTGASIDATGNVTGFTQTGTVQILVFFRGTFGNGTQYRIYDELITIEVK
jgi:glycerophosphoryl diester phosphodiesterase